MPIAYDGKIYESEYDLEKDRPIEPPGSTQTQGGTQVPPAENNAPADNVEPVRGIIETGNIDTHKRPVVHNPDGSISTVRTISIGTDRGEVVIPTVSDDGRIMEDEEAKQTYFKSGKHLGIFDTSDNATAFAQSLHNQQTEEYLPKRGVVDKLLGTTGERYQTWPEKMVRGAVSAFALPGDVLSGKVKAGSVQEIERAAELAGLIIGGPAPVASKLADGTLGSFAGVRSKTLDKGALEVAQLAEKEGLSPDEIWNKTGFFKGSDNRWRYEIDDSGLELKEDWHKQQPSNKHLYQGEEYLEKVMKHPELYKSYPELRDVKIKVQPGMPHGSAYWDGQKIVVSESVVNNKGVIMHEVQHAIQDMEKFASGGSAGKVGKDYKLRYEDDINKLRKPFLELQAKEVSTLTSEEKEQLAKYTEIFKKYAEYARAGDKQARENYLALAGESEAVNTEIRVDLSPRERAAVSPMDSQPFSNAEQIITYRPVRTNPYMKPGELR